MSKDRCLTEITIQVISDTPLTLSMLQEIQTALELYLPWQKGGPILSVNLNSTPLEVLH